MPVEVIAAGLVGLALLWLVLQPMVLPGRATPVDLDPLDPEESPRGQALLALKEIEFDRATGKLSEADYAELTARYRQAAIAALDIPAHSIRCPTHGPRAEADARYCAECGAGLIDDAGACVNCRSPIPTDAAFCPGCGAQLTPR